MIFRPCRDEEAIKPRSASFLPPEGFLFRRSFCCSLSRARQRRQRCSSDGEGHLNKPSVKPRSRDRQAQWNLWPSSPAFPHWGLSSQLPDLPNGHVLSPLSSFPSSPFPTQHSHPSSECPFIFLHSSIWYLFSPPSPDNLASCSSRQCLQSSKKCWVASQKQHVGVFLASGKFVSSLCSIPQLNVTWKHPGKTD